MKKNILFLIFFLSLCKIDCQNTIDCIFLMKTNIFLGHNFTKNQESIIIDKKKFDETLEGMYLCCDTLQSNIKENKYIFLSVNIDDTLQFKFLNKKQEFFFWNDDSNQKRRFVIGVNMTTGKSFKLMGFEENEILTFLEDLQKYMYNTQFTSKKIIKEYWVENLDLKCLLNSVGKKYDPIKYPCTKRCSDGLIRIH